MKARSIFHHSEKKIFECFLVHILWQKISFNQLPLFLTNFRVGQVYVTLIVRDSI